MSAQAEPRGGSGVWDFLRNLSEKQKGSSSEQMPEEHPRMRIGRYAAAVLPAALLLYYCTHAALYAGEHHTFILASGRTYVVSLICFLLIVLALVPVRLSEHANRITSWGWFLLAPFAVYFSLLYMNASKYSIKFFELNRIALVLTFVFLFLFETAVLILTGSIRFAVVTMAVLIAALGIANSFVIAFRGMALSAADLFSLGAAASVASEYTYELDWYMYMELLCTLAICMFSLKLHGGRILHPAVRAAVLVLWCGVAGSFYYLCCRTDFLEQHDIRSQGFTHQLRYKNYDMIFTTLTTCFYLSVEKPEGYSLDKVKEIAAPYLTEDAGDDANAAAADTDVRQASSENTTSQTDGKNKTASDGKSTASTSGNAAANAAIAAGETPNLIVIMNESFADYTSIGKGLDLSEDCMPFIHSLTENTIKGTAYVSIFGGNTPNSEYEFLTGNTMAFLPTGSVPYQQFLNGAMPSLASQLGKLGYQTAALHPYYSTGWNRDKVYQYLGFDSEYFRDTGDFPDATLLRGWVDDESAFDKLIELYEEKEEGSPLFAFEVTMQNHGGYSKEYEDLTNEIQFSDAGEDLRSVHQVQIEATEKYLTLIKKTDEAFENLIDYFQDEDEKTIILMFGDHQPAEYITNSVLRVLGEDTATRNDTTDKLKTSYEVPFVMWANYDIEEKEVDAISTNYLSGLLMDTAGLEKTGYQSWLEKLQQQYPVVTANFYQGTDGTFQQWSNEKQSGILNDYAILQYNNLVDKKHRIKNFFADISEKALE